MDFGHKELFRKNWILIIVEPVARMSAKVAVCTIYNDFSRL